MLKTVLKILAYYLLLTLLVSGCSLIGEYAEGINGTPNGTAHTVPSAEGEAKGKQSKSISISESGKLKQAKVVFDTKAESESNPIKVSNITEQPSQEVKPIYTRVDALQMDAPRDLVKSAFEELRKRRKFFVTKSISRYLKCWREEF